MHTCVTKSHDDVGICSSNHMHTCHCEVMSTSKLTVMKAGHTVHLIHREEARSDTLHHRTSKQVLLQLLKFVLFLGHVHAWHGR
jgi:hypothetical protein